jgi:hypothetical protein
MPGRVRPGVDGKRSKYCQGKAKGEQCQAECAPGWTGNEVLFKLVLNSLKVSCGRKGTDVFNCLNGPQVGQVGFFIDIITLISQLI